MIVAGEHSISMPEPCVATIGFFDGVHLGHRYLMDQVRRIARNAGLVPAVITFPIHPRRVLQHDYIPELLTTYPEKMSLLEEAGTGYAFVLDFTPDIARLSAKEFMRDILKKRYNVQSLVVGHDHRFGHNRREDFADYCSFGKELSMPVMRARACTIDNVEVSSSVVRKRLHASDVAGAAEYLGYEYFLNGTVVGGYRIGRTIGFPTANIQVGDPQKLIPPDGAYAVRVSVDNKTYGGILNIGRRPTMNNGSDRSIEVHILRFRSDIYDFPIRISFVDHIRQEMKFPDKQALAAQLREDVREAERLLAR